METLYKILPKPAAHPCGLCLTEDGPLPNVSKEQVDSYFNTSLKQWAKAKTLLAPEDMHESRYKKCQTCEFFKGFWCEKSRAIAYAQTKIKDAVCPDSPPRWE